MSPARGRGRATSGRSARPAAYVALLLVGCSTIGPPSDGEQGLPSSGVGPFRKLGPNEVNGVAPFVLDDAKAHFREPAALPLSSGGVAMYLVEDQTDASGATHAVIARTRADDGRSFFGAPLDSGHAPRVVLGADAAWEGADLTGPSAVDDAGGGVLLFYAAKGGIGLARSSDGFAFHKEARPVVGADGAGAWETTPPHAPSVAHLPDGRLRMVYAAGACLGEAESDGDPGAWRRLDADPSTPALDPILCPSPRAAAGSLLPGEAPPFDTVLLDDPLLLPRTTPAGRLQMRVLYTGIGDAVDGGRGAPSAIGFAARYGDHGPLGRAASPVYSIGKHEASPALYELGDGTALLYVSQDQTNGGGFGGAPTGIYPAIGAALAPATMKLAPPAPFASSP